MIFRAKDVQRLFQVGLNTVHGFQSSVFLGSRRKFGKTTVLRQVYDRLLREQERVIPFFYSVPKSTKSVELFSRDYFQQAFLQFLAFNRRETRELKNPGLDAGQMLPLAYETRYAWLVDAVRQYHIMLKNRDLIGLIKLAVSLPEQVALNSGLHAFVLIDDFHHLDKLTPPDELANLKSQFLLALESRRAPHLLSGTPKPTFRHLYSKGELTDSLETIFLEPLELSETVQLFEVYCHENDVPWDASMSSLVIEQLDRNPYYLQLLAKAAKYTGDGLRSPKRFAELYLKELTQKSLHHYFSGLLQEVLNDPAQFVRAIELLAATSRLSAPCPFLQFKEEQKDPVPGQLDQTLRSLDEVGLIDFENGIVSPLPDRVLEDWVGWNVEHKIRGRSLTQVKFDLTSELLRRYQEAVENREKEEILSQTKDALLHMDQQIMPRLLFDYGEYHSFSGEPPDKLYAPQPETEQSIQLPQFLSVEIRSVITPRTYHHGDQVLLARGYENRIYSSSREVAWVAGYCPASVSLGLDEIIRFHKLARLIEQEENLPHTHYWLIGKERFNQAALSYAKESEIFTSNLDQLSQLTRRVCGKGKSTLEPLETSGRDSYEMSIPMSGGSEMVAVRALEQVAESLDMAEKSKGQLRMALLEACIHLKENFAFQADKIHFIFSPQPTRLDVHIRVEVRTNQSQGLPDPFGARILRTLLDDVRFIETSQGLELTLSKSLSAANGEVA
jgi:hypothetical protein